MRRRALLASAASAASVGAAGCLDVGGHVPDARLLEDARGYDPKTWVVTDTVGYGEQHPTIVAGDRSHVDDPDAHRRRTVFLLTSETDRDLDLVVRADGRRIFEYEAQYGAKDWQLFGFLEPADYELAFHASTGSAGTGLSDRYVPAGGDTVRVSIGPLGPEASRQYVTLDADAFDSP